MDKLEFADRLINLRHNRGLSQKELGDLLGVSNKAISKWENGESLPKTETMLKLAELFGIDGNELLGIEKTETNGTDSDSQAEINRLKDENKVLNLKLKQYRSNKKRLFIIAVCVCIAAVLAAAVISLVFSYDFSSYNKSVKNAGEKNTKIIFNGIEFFPCSESENYLLAQNDTEFDETAKKQNAVFEDSDGGGKNVVINASSLFKAVKIKAENGSFYYIDRESVSLKITKDNIKFISFGRGSFLKSEIYSGIDENGFFAGSAEGEKVISEFCDFYNSLGQSADKKITEHYLGNKGKTVFVRLKKGGFCECRIGEFFEDGNSNLYFYSYITGEAYSAGEEMKNIVNR